MGGPVTEFVPFGEGDFPRYTFDYDNRVIRDTKFSRDLVAGCKRGGRPYYRLVNSLDEAVHVRAEDIFGEDANEDISVDSDFDPMEFSSRYAFNFPEGAVLRKPGKGPKSGEPMTLLSPCGWKHYLLTRNDGVRVRVTPAEIRKFESCTDWVVNPPEGARVFDHIFPGYAFTPSGEVFRIRSKKPLLAPEPVPVDRVADPGSPNPDRETAYRMMSKSGEVHIFTRASIKELFRKKRKEEP